MGANQELNKCLQSYRNTLPTTRFELFLSVCWQIVRQLLHRLFIGRWLSKFTGGFFINE